ncbi:hypothetical protein CDD81_7143 [Ophiocordyceps australis]|uniref:Nuclear condensin complex subunit 3 C-terminal domain-containing protein n=1 Tax=Ophiocordyceps australis TaxID=1399860 RepID=A0A2C5Y631_9HYPO|nr:hypothetical protein CDD81_7143 [Ophiocordyceps australis]
MAPRGSRLSSRTSRTSSAISKKSSVATLASRTSMAAVEYSDSPGSELRTQMCAIFGDAQRSTATHRKLAMSLRKIHEACCYEAPSGKRGPMDEFDETAFNKEFVRCVVHMMPVKKTESVGERCIRFVAFYLALASEKDHGIAEHDGDGDDDDDVMPETPTMRLTGQVLETALPLMAAKDKVVRFRATQLVSQVFNSLDAIDDDVFVKVRQGLLKRIRDKEAMVRCQAVLGLSRLAGTQGLGDGNSGDSSDDDEARDASAGLVQKLLQVMQNDPSAEVRRSLLVNLPILPTTLPHLLERARDQDAATRRAVYSRLLPALGDFRHLSLSMREKLLRWGLRDGDENVRKAAGRLFCERWIADCVGSAQQPEGEQAAEADAAPSVEALLELLERIDVVNSGVETGVALEAMRGFWAGRPDYRDAIVLDDGFWETLTAESVFMARSLNDFCRLEEGGRHEALIEDKLPEVTKLAFFLERYMQAMVEAVSKAWDDEEDEAGDETVEQEFIVEQLLHIALTLDYADEVGRRKMFGLLRHFVSVPELPDEVTKLSIEALRLICAPDLAGEEEFCSVVLEAVADVHDTITDDDDSFHSAKSEVSKASRARDDDDDEQQAAHQRAIREIVINIKCLYMVQCMLTHVAGRLKDNAHLVSMLNNLVVPAVRSHEAPVRERGLVCLGLCALLDRSLAEENLGLFIHFFAKGHAALQVTALHILTDMLNVHGADLLAASPQLLRVYIKAVRAAPAAPVQAAAVLAASKLLLGRILVQDDACKDLLRALVIAYFDPASAANHAVRQALVYFLPVFCYSAAANQQLMRAVALPALHALFALREGLQDHDDLDISHDMLSLTTIGAYLVDWTDPRKCYLAGQDLLSESAERKSVNGDVHLDFAQDIMQALCSNISKEEKKLVAGLLGKLHVSPASSEDKLRHLYALVSQAVDDGLLVDATSRNALYKIHVSLGKIVNTLDQPHHIHPRPSLLTPASPSLRRSSRSASALRDGHEATLTDQPHIKEEQDESDQGELHQEEEQATSPQSKVPKVEQDATSLLQDLLSDGEDVKMGDT